MPAVGFIAQLLGWRSPQLPNTADGDSDASVGIASEILHILGIGPETVRSAPGADVLRKAVAAFLDSELLTKERDFSFTTAKTIADFAQYRHLSELEDIAEQFKIIGAEFGFDYLVRPDVSMGLQRVGDTVLMPPFLHAAIWCRWSIRSDRIQSLRREGEMLARHRRGRQPHIIVVTTEPLPTRLAAIARGTGEVDSIFHLMFEELQIATKRVGLGVQKETLDELIGQSRLRDFSTLAQVLAI
jgi:hypothetical protein